MENTTTAPDHTPTPWTIEDARREPGTPWAGQAWDGFMVRSADGLVAVAYTPPNAAFIVRACNTHENLLDALEYLLTQTVDMDLNQGITLTEGEQEARDRALSVIAEARGL